MAQRIFGIALGYEDLNDHDQLRHDPLLAILVGKDDPTGQDRVRRRDRGKALAGKSTLNRLELSPPRAGKVDRYKKITADLGAMESLLSDFFLEAERLVTAALRLSLRCLPGTPPSRQNASCNPRLSDSNDSEKQTVADSQFEYVNVADDGGVAGSLDASLRDIPDERRKLMGGY